METPGYPQFIRVDDTVFEKYLKPLLEDKSSPFYKSDQGPIYMLAGSIGLSEGLRVRLKGKSKDVRTYAGLSDDWKALIRAAAWQGSGQDPEVLLDGKKTLAIFQEYVAGGASILHDLVLGKPSKKLSFPARIEKMLGEFSKK